MAQNISLWGASYSDVPAVQLPKTGGGTASFTDVTSTTAAASDVASGKYFFTAQGVLTVGTASGGGSGTVVVEDTTDSHGGTIREITAVDISDTTAVAADVASGKYFYTANGTKTQGSATIGGGIDIPVFTVAIDEITEDITIACNKTYAECYALVDYDNPDRNNTAIIRIPIDEGGYDFSGMTGNIYTDELVYVAVSVDGYPYFEIHYPSNGTITYTQHASILQTLNVSANGTYTATYGEEIWDEVNVAVPTGTARTGSDVDVTGATVTIPAGLYSSQVTKTVASGTVTAPASITGTSATVSTGTNTLTLSKTVSVTPNVTTAGYISSGTAGNSSVSLTASVTTKGATTYNTSSSDQTIASGTYLTGTQTIRGVTTSNLTAENIKSGVVVTVGDSADADRVLSVTGTYTGGGGSSKAIYTYKGLASRTANSYGSTNASVTVTKAGTYTISYVAVRGSSSGTMGTNLHIGSTSGTNNTTWNSGTYGQAVTLTNQTISANTTVTIYATSGNTSRTIYVGNLIVEEE